MTEEQTAGQTLQAIDLMQFVPKVHFEQIPIRNLVSNQEYQRNLSQHHVQRAAANFDLYQINPVKVSRRNGINYVFNGQHTIEIVALVSGSRETPVWCMVYDDLGYEHEADIFANQMKYVKPLLPYEIFMAKRPAMTNSSSSVTWWNPMTLPSHPPRPRAVSVLSQPWKTSTTNTATICSTMSSVSLRPHGKGHPSPSVQT